MFSERVSCVLTPYPIEGQTKALFEAMVKWILSILGLKEVIFGATRAEIEDVFCCMPASSDHGWGDVRNRAGAWLGRWTA